MNSSVFEFKHDLLTKYLLAVNDRELAPVNTNYQTRKFGDTLWTDHNLIIPLRIIGNEDSIEVQVVKNDKSIFGFSQGAHIPNFRSQSVAGKAIDLYKYKAGGYLLIDFFGSWCMPCIGNFPKLKKLHEKYSEYGLKVLGIANERDSNLVALTKLMTKEKFKWEVISQNKTTNYAIITMARIHTFPTYLLISPDNKIIYECGGGSDFDEIEKILEKKLIKRKY